MWSEPPLRRCLRPVALALLGSMAGTAQASDWPQYKRDALRAADAADETLTPPLQRVLAVRFSAPLYASPAVVGGKVYAVDARGLLACIEQATQRVVWKAQIGGEANRSSPAVAGGKVFVGSTAGYLLVLDAQTGQEVAKVPAEGGVIAAPVATAEAVYFLSFNARLTKVDFSGKPVWSYLGGKSANGEFMVQGKHVVFWGGPVDEKGPADPYGLHVLEDQGASVVRKQLLRRAELEPGKVKFGNSPEGSETGLFQRESWAPVFGVTRRGAAYLYRETWPQSGTLYWGGPTGHRAWPSGYLSQPVLTKDQVVLGDADGRLHFYPLVPDQKFKGQPVWSYETSQTGKPNGGISSTAAVSNGVLFIGGEDGILYGLGQGKETGIVAVLPQAAPVAVSRPGEKLKGPEWPTVGGDMSYCTLSPDTNLKPPFKMHWKTRIVGSGAQNSIIVVAGRVFVASYNGFVEALDAETGEVIWRTYQAGIFRNEYPNDGPPTYSDGKLLIMRRNGLWCHDAKTGVLLWQNPKPELPIPGGAPQGDGQVVSAGKVLCAWHEKGDGLESAALDLATGKELWHVRHEGVIPSAPAEVKKVSMRVCQGALGEDKWFLSVSLNKENGEGPYLGGATLALDPANGKLLWKNTERSSSGWGGLNYRNGTVVLYSCMRGWYALEAKTGKELWKSASFGLGGGPFHTAPLTDDFLATQGRKGFSGGYCADTVWVNGFVYGPPGSSSHALVARSMDGREWWRYVVLSRGCPAPAPAYGRLYYAGFSEGVVYCFVNQERERSSIF